jgi:hypothetical protein
LTNIFSWRRGNLFLIHTKGQSGPIVPLVQGQLWCLYPQCLTQALGKSRHWTHIHWRIVRTFWASEFKNCVYMLPRNTSAHASGIVLYKLVQQQSLVTSRSLLKCHIAGIICLSLCSLNTQHFFQKEHLRSKEFSWL